MPNTEDVDKTRFKIGSVGFFINDWREGVDISEPFAISNIELGYSLYCNWFKSCAYKPHKASLIEYKQVLAQML